MMFSIRLHPKVSKFLDKCDKKLSLRVKAKLKEIKEDPFAYLEHYEGDDFYKLRIGDYRTLIDVDTSNNVLYVQYIDHRKRIYKRK